MQNEKKIKMISTGVPSASQQRRDEKKSEPVVVKPSVKEEQGDDTFYDFDDMEISKRSDDIQQATADYLNQLLGDDDCSVDDFFSSLSDFETLIDRIEEVLWDEFGIIIYRPRIVTDEDGIDHCVSSIADVEGLVE